MTFLETQCPCCSKKFVDWFHHGYAEFEYRYCEKCAPNYKLESCGCHQCEDWNGCSRPFFYKQIKECNHEKNQVQNKIR